MVKIEKVQTKKQTREFVNFPLKLYKGCPYYVPQLYADEIKTFAPGKNETEKYYMEAYLARNEKGEVVGRVAAIVHKQFNELYKDKRVRFSRFDLIDDFEVCKALIGAVENFAKENKMHTICGPMGVIDQDREGLLTEGFDRISTFSLNYNYEYYQKHLEKLGYTKEAIWNEKIIEIDKIDHQRFEKLAGIVMKRNNLKLLKGSTHYILKNYRYKVFDFVNETYGHLYGYVPLSHADIDRLVKSYEIALKAKFISILLDQNDEVVAFALSMPSIAQAVRDCRGKLNLKGIFKILHALNHPKVSELLLIGVKESYRKSGVAVVVMNQLIQAAKKAGIKTAESNAQLLTNTSIQQIYENLNPQVVRFRASYVKKLK